MKRTVLSIGLALLAVFALSTLASGIDAQTWSGWITDEHCGAKGAKADHKACAEKCAKTAKLVFYNSGDEKIYSLDNQDLAKQHLGHAVKVTGTVDGVAIKVATIEAAS